jgi:hypothetical protein
VSFPPALASVSLREQALELAKQKRLRNERRAEEEKRENVRRRVAAITDATVELAREVLLIELAPVHVHAVVADSRFDESDDYGTFTTTGDLTFRAKLVNRGDGCGNRRVLLLQHPTRDKESALVSDLESVGETLLRWEQQREREPEEQRPF